MPCVELYEHQSNALEATKDQNRVAYYHDMGLGKTFTGSEKLIQLGAKVNLVICQKSKIQDWINHFKEYYKDVWVYDITNKKQFDCFIDDIVADVDERDGNLADKFIAVINYDLVFRRKELLKLSDFTLMLDESSLIQNETAKRSKFVLKMRPKNVILLSGTPTGGKYERLWSQLSLLGWNIPKKMFYDHYVDFYWDDSNGFPLMIITGYKNEDRLKRKMRAHGCNFLKTDEVFDLPQQVHQNIMVKITKEYKKFKKDSIVMFNDPYDVENGYTLVGDTVLTQMLYERQLCGQYNLEKLMAFRDLVESTDDRIIVFYNFTAELEALKLVLRPLNRPYSLVNGSSKDLSAYDKKSDSVTFIQYQAGAMGLNLQKANKIIYFTPPLSSELFEQSKKRIHRIGQSKPCFYYYLTCKNSIEQRIYATLKMRKDYTEALFERGE